MKENTMKGNLILFDGRNKSGKSTIINILRKAGD